MTLKDLEKRLEKEPDNLPLRVTVAGMMSDAGRKAEAVEHYRRVAIAYRALGRPQQALAVARSILEIAPNDVAIHTLVTELTAPKAPEPAPAPRFEERKPSAAEPTKTGVRGAPEPRSAAEIEVPDLDDLDTKPPSATGSRPPGMLDHPVVSRTATGMRPVTTSKGPKSTPPVIRIPEKKSDSQPPASATFRSQPPPPPRRSPFPDDVTDPETAPGPPRRSSFDTPTPLPQPVPYHLADPTSSQDRISRGDLAALDVPVAEPSDDASRSGGLAQAARRISSLIKPRSEKPTRNPFMPDPTLRPDAPPQPAPARTAKPTVDPYADKPIVARSDKPTRQPPLARSDKATQNPFTPDKLVPPAKLPSIARPGQPAPPPGEPRPTVPLRPQPAPTLPARTPPVTSTSKTQPRPVQPMPPDDARPTAPRSAQPTPDDAVKTEPQPALPRLGDTFRAQPPPAGAAPMLPVARPPLRPSSAGPPTLKADPPPAARPRPRPSVPAPARDGGSSGVRAAPRPAAEASSSGVRAVPRPLRDTGSAGTRVENLPPVPEPGAEHLPPPPAAPPRAPSVVPRTPSYSDEVVAELDTRERPRLSSDDLEKIASPPPTVPTEQIVLDDDVTPPPQQWAERRARSSGPPIRDTPMDPPTDVHTSVARDTNLDMRTEAGTDVQGSSRDTRRDAAVEPPEDERTAPRELVGPEPLANAFFLPIPLNRRDAALTRCIRRVVRAGQTVIRQGETSHPLYLVVSGQLELRIERANGTLGKLDEIDAGQYIGEGSLLARSPAIGHVIASANSELLALPPHALFELAGAYPALWAALKDTAERRARMYEKLLRG